MARIYLDYNASTPIDPEVVAVMRPLLTHYGNPSSGHWAAPAVRAALDTARAGRDAARECGRRDRLHQWRSEANNLALKGWRSMPPRRPAHVITSQIEHPATLELPNLTRLGVAVTKFRSMTPASRSRRVEGLSHPTPA